MEPPFSLKSYSKPLAPLSVAKFLKTFFLVDEDEMKDLFSFLEKEISPFWFFQMQGVMNKGEGILSSATFLEHYSNYVTLLKKGEVPSEHFQKEFASALSVTPEAVYSLSVAGEKQIIKPVLPIVQVQLNRIRYSPEDNSFRTQVYGTDTITWGLQLAYPQVAQDPLTHQILDTENSPNTPLFKSIQKWIRHATRATPFVVGGVKQNEPIRLGKKCFSWINGHPDLKKLNLSVHVD